MSTSIGLLRGIGIIEGISYLVLLFIAVPLKYAAGFPGLVQIFGMVHGVLFIPFVLMLVIVWFRHRWPLFSVLWSIHCVAFAVRHVCSRCPLAEKL
ncbi:DUF3817 domain-containing protein [Vibrio hannami]|nr:DUF3817 domain-containing protein [Vibrio hannami]MDG3086619.1 DUF3817 domain-containing protein [Vibrio hannami]